LLYRVSLYRHEARNFQDNHPINSNFAPTELRRVTLWFRPLRAWMTDDVWHFHLPRRPFSCDGVSCIGSYVGVVARHMQVSIAATEAQPALWFNLCWYRCTSTWSPTHQQSVFKRYHSDVHFSRVLPTRWRQKSTGTDMKENYVPDTLCITSVGATALRDRWDACLPTSNDTRSYFNVRSKADMSRSA